MASIVRNSRGVASVEFVMILPTLLIVLFLGAELSRAWFTMNLMTTAAREAVRAAVVAPAAQVSTVGNARINAFLGAGNWTGTGVTCSTNPCAPDSQVTANITVNFTPLFPVLIQMLPALTLQQTASMRYE